MHNINQIVEGRLPEEHTLINAGQLTKLMRLHNVRKKLGGFQQSTSLILNGGVTAVLSLDADRIPGFSLFFAYLQCFILLIFNTIR